MFGSFVIAGPYIRAGRLRAIGASGATRNTQAPEYLTIAEQGYPGFSQEAWFGLVAPVGTANSAIERLNQEISVVLANTDLQQQLIRTGFDPIPAMSVVEFSRIYISDVTQWSKVVRDAKILPE
jgi:tripartite-type tricarboxylate transporter receptor subunit TctC